MVSNHSILRPFLDLILLIFKLLKIKLSSLIIGVKTFWLICVISFSSNLVKLLANKLIAQRNLYCKRFPLAFQNPFRYKDQIVPKKSLKSSGIKPITNSTDKVVKCNIFIIKVNKQASKITV